MNPFRAAASQFTRPGLQRWFIVGFLLVFVGMLLFVHEYTPFRNGVLICKLWQYYLIEIPKMFSSHRGIGIGLPNPESVMVKHGVMSIVGGLVSMGVGTLFKRFRSQQRPFYSLVFLCASVSPW